MLLITRAVHADQSLVRRSSQAWPEKMRSRRVVLSTSSSVGIEVESRRSNGCRMVCICIAVSQHRASMASARSLIDILMKKGQRVKINDRVDVSSCFPPSVELDLECPSG